MAAYGARNRRRRLGATTAEPDDDSAILEFTRIGPAVRVAAMDPATLTEVVIQGPAAAGEAALTEAALRKLAYVLGRRRRSPGPL